MKTQKLPGGVDLQKQFKAATEYKGLAYTEADFAKMPKV